MRQKHPFLTRKGNDGFRPSGHLAYCTQTRCPWLAPTPPPPNFARNLSWSFFETPQKRCNSSDANSRFETVTGELRAKLVSAGCDARGRLILAGHTRTTGATSEEGTGEICRRAGGRWRGLAGHTRTTGTAGVEGTGGICRGAGGRWRGLAGLRDDAPSEARGADGSRAGRHPPAHTAAGPSGARNTSGTTSTGTTKRAGTPRFRPALNAQWRSAYDARQ